MIWGSPFPWPLHVKLKCLPQRLLVWLDSIHCVPPAIMHSLLLYKLARACFWNAHMPYFSAACHRNESFSVVAWLDFASVSVPVYWLLFFHLSLYVFPSSGSGLFMGTMGLSPASHISWILQACVARQASSASSLFSKSTQVIHAICWPGVPTLLGFG